MDTEMIKPDIQSLIEAYETIMLSSKYSEDYPLYTRLYYHEDNNTVELGCDCDGVDAIIIWDAPDLLDCLGGVPVDDWSDEDIKSTADALASISEYNTFKIVD